MSYKKLIDQNLLEIGTLDAINRGGSAVQKYIKMPPEPEPEPDDGLDTGDDHLDTGDDELVNPGTILGQDEGGGDDGGGGEEGGGCIVDELPIIGQPYVDHFDNPDVSGEMMVYKIDTNINNGIQEYIVFAKSYGDIFDRHSFEFTLGGDIIAIHADDESSEMPEDWKWDSDDAPVKQAIFKSSLSGSVTIPVYMPVTEHGDYMIKIQNCAGKINDSTALTHPGLALFKEGELLFNTISGGTTFPGPGNDKVEPDPEDEEDEGTPATAGQEYISFDLTFSFRIISDIESDTWQYIYRPDTGIYDIPKIGSVELYEKADFSTLFSTEPPITVNSKTITGKFKQIMSSYQVIDENRRPTATMGYITKLDGDPTSECDVDFMTSIGDTYDDPTEYSPSANMSCNTIRRESLGNGRFRWTVSYQYNKANVDSDDFNYSGGGEVISLTPTESSEGELSDNWKWVWGTDNVPVYNAVFKAAMVGSVSVTKVIGEDEYETWIAEVQADAGKVNSKNYKPGGGMIITHPGVTGFAKGQLLFSSISGGNRTCNYDGSKAYVFELTFMYRIVGGTITEDDWQYIYRKDTATYDKPVSANGYLYEESEFGSL